MPSTRSRRSFRNIKDIRVAKDLAEFQEQVPAESIVLDPPTTLSGDTAAYEDGRYNPSPNRRKAPPASDAEPTLSTQQLLEEFKKARNQKKKSLLDRQENAISVRFDDDGEDEDIAVPRAKKRKGRPDEDGEPPATPSKVARGKRRRTRSTEEDEEAFEEAFEEPRPNKIQQRRANKPSAPATSQSFGFRHPSDVFREARRSVPLTNAPDAVPSRSRTESRPSESYEVVNRQAREFVAVSQPIKGPQVRRPWDAEECNRLIELIKLYGISWSLLKDRDEKHEDGPRLTHRDQVALKDKARNIKLDYLKTGQTIHPNLDLVPLKKADLAKLPRYY